MWHSVKVFLFLPPLLFALDYVWLGVFASDLYKKELGSFLRMSGTALQPIVWAALLVYLALPLGIVLFVLPRIPADSFARAVVYAMSQPDDVDINEILFRPTSQDL